MLPSRRTWSVRLSDCRVIYRYLSGSHVCVETCELEFSRYPKTRQIRLQLRAIETDELMAEVTTHRAGSTAVDTEVVVNSAPENEGVLELLQEAGVIGKCIRDSVFELLRKPNTFL